MAKRRKASPKTSNIAAHSVDTVARSAQKVIDSGVLSPIVDRLPNINDEHVEALYGFGYDLFHGKKYEEAESIFYLVCNLNHMEKKYWKALAITFFLQKKYQAAQATYFTALMLDPTDVEMMSAMADCAIAMGSVPDADNLLVATVEMSYNYQQRLDLGQRAKALLEMLRGYVPPSDEPPATESQSDEPLTTEPQSDEPSAIEFQTENKEAL